MTKPRPTDYVPGDIGDAFGRALHGDRWPEVKQARAEQIAQAAVEEARQARRERIKDALAITYALVVFLAVLAVLIGLAVAVWRWAL